MSNISASLELFERIALLGQISARSDNRLWYFPPFFFLIPKSASHLSRKRETPVFGSLQRWDVRCNVQSWAQFFRRSSKREPMMPWKNLPPGDFLKTSSLSLHHRLRSGLHQKREIADNLLTHDRTRIAV